MTRWMKIFDMQNIYTSWNWTNLQIRILRYDSNLFENTKWVNVRQKLGLRKYPGMFLDMINQSHLLMFQTLIPRTSHRTLDIQMQIQDRKGFPDILFGSNQEKNMKSMGLQPGFEYDIELDPYGQLSTDDFKAMSSSRRPFIWCMSKASL